MTCAIYAQCNGRVLLSTNRAAATSMAPYRRHDWQTPSPEMLSTDSIAETESRALRPAGSVCGQAAAHGFPPLRFPADFCFLLVLALSHSVIFRVLHGIPEHQLPSPLKMEFLPTLDSSWLIEWFRIRVLQAESIDAAVITIFTDDGTLERGTSEA